MARTKKQILVGGKTPQMRAKGKAQGQGKSGWTAARSREFLSVLAETLNVSEACRASGLPSSAVYGRRKINAAFRAGWREAVAMAYQRLELLLLERAFNGVEKVVTRRDGSEERMREYSDQLGLQLLKQHRGSAIEAAPESQPEDIEDIRKRLFDKLERMRKREDGRVATL